jgi:hypothetical protein
MSGEGASERMLLCAAAAVFIVAVLVLVGMQ